jgi:putative endonuclease
LKNEQHSRVAQWYLPAGRQGAVVTFPMDNNYTVYVIQSKVDNRLYVGMSKNVQNRLQEHNIGRVFSTKGYRPWILVYTEFIGERKNARQREKYFKSGFGKEHLKSIIPG